MEVQQFMDARPISTVPVLTPDQVCWLVPE